MQPWLKLSAMSFSAALTQSMSVFLSVELIPPKTILVRGLWATNWALLVSESYVATRAMLICVAWTANWGHGDIQTALLFHIMFGYMVLTQLGSVLISMVHVATKGHPDAWVLGCNLWTWCPEDSSDNRAMTTCITTRSYGAVWSQAVAKGMSGLFIR